MFASMLIFPINEPNKPFEPAELKILPLDPDLLIASGEDEEKGFGDLHFF